MHTIQEALADLKEEQNIRQQDTLRFQNEKKNRWIHEGFVVVGNSVLSDPAVSAPAKIVYLLLMRRLFQKDNCFPGR